MKRAAFIEMPLSDAPVLPAVKPEALAAPTREIARADWIGSVSRYDRFRGLLGRPPAERKAVRQGIPARDTQPDPEPCDIWIPYVVPVCDQGESGMCETFSTAGGISVPLRKFVDFALFTGVPEDKADDACFDPHPAHRRGREQYAPGEPYDRAEGLPSRTSIAAMRELGQPEETARARPIRWRDIPREIWNGPILLPMLVWDGWPAERLSGFSEIAWPRDPTIIHGGHQTYGVRTFRGKTGRWLLGCVNSWIPEAWGYHGFYTIDLELAEWGALDEPSVVELGDLRFYRETSKWREAIVLRSELDAWLKA